MTVHTIIISGRYDWIDLGTKTMSYESEELARKAFEDLVKEEKARACKAGWDIEEDRNSFKSFLDGHECNNHHKIILCKTELTGAHPVSRTVFGRDLIDKLEDYDRNVLQKDCTKPAEEQREDILDIMCCADGMLCQRTFSTEAEYKAYRDGVEDTGRWQDKTDGDRFPFITDGIWEKKELNRDMPDTSLQNVCRLLGTANSEIWDMLPGETQQAIIEGKFKTN